MVVYEDRRGLVAHGSLPALLGQVQRMYSDQFEDGDMQRAQTRSLELATRLE